MKKQAKKFPMPFKPGKRMGPAKVFAEGKPVDVEPKGMVEGSPREEKADERLMARKSRPSVI